MISEDVAEDAAAVRGAAAAQQSSEAPEAGRRRRGRPRRFSCRAPPGSGLPGSPPSRAKRGGTAWRVVFGSAPSRWLIRETVLWSSCC